MSGHEKAPPASTHGSSGGGDVLCPLCAAPAAAAQQFCGKCGAALSRACSACGARNPPANNFCGACGARLGTETEMRAVLAKEPAAQPSREERRWVTLLFADISGFTAMAEQMDPEDVKAMAHGCIDRMGEQVYRFGGTVLNVAGDQIFAVFGAPLAHEDDPERAVRAGLAIRECLLSQESTPPITVHIGINTGEVMAGFVGPAEHRGYTVMGDAVNTAARLMSSASAGSVLVGEETWRATRRSVQYRELPAVAVKGKERPLSVWEVLGASVVHDARPLGTAPLVGRDEELALLSDIWLKVVREGRPHLIAVLGEPGIGKSRLVAEFERRYCADALVLHGRCLPYGEVLGYSALTTVLNEAAGIPADAGANTARVKLTDLVRQAFEPEGPADDSDDDLVEVSRHMALLCGLDTSADRSAKPADQRTLHASVRRFLEALARRKPLCLMFEDIHWADDALLDLIEFIASRTKEAPLLIVTQARPGLLEKRPNWGGGVRAFTSLPLEPLDETSGRELILALCRERGLAESVAEHVGRGAGGNPLFAEELVAMTAERGSEAGIPSAIKVLISARLDALPPAQRNTLQLAAVFGKTFWAAGLSALGAHQDSSEHLEALEHRDLLRAQPRSQFRNEREYAFKHDLIRDVAYDMLPRAERRMLHGRVADWIERAAGERVEAYFDRLAHHTLQAGQAERAMGYLLQAAARARRASAYRQEAALLAQAIGVADQLGRRQEVAQLRVRRGSSFGSVGMWTAARPELEAALMEFSQDQMEQRAEALIELAGACFWLLDTRAVRESTTEALNLAERAGRNDLAAAALAWLGGAQQADGDTVSARLSHQGAIARAGGLPVASLALAPLNSYLLGQTDEALDLGRKAAQILRESAHADATVWGLPHLGLALAAKGRYADALEVFFEARRLGQEYEIWPFLARVVAMSAGFHLDVYDLVGNEHLNEEARELAAAHSFLPPAVSAGIELLLNFARSNQPERADKLLDGVAAEVLKGAGWHGWLWKIRFAEAQAELAYARGQFQQAVQWAENTITQSASRSRIKYQALGLWTRARSLHRLERTREALADLHTAIKLARSMDDPAIFLRVAAPLLAIDGDDVTLQEARAAAQLIRTALPTEEMRRRFEAAEPVHLLSKFCP
jgi:class 3 adenylate cyclase/tetratricopeptide (TPR) repeat protein